MRGTTVELLQDAPTTSIDGKGRVELTLDGHGHGYGYGYRWLRLMRRDSRRLA